MASLNVVVERFSGELAWVHTERGSGNPLRNSFIRWALAGRIRLPW